MLTITDRKVLSADKLVLLIDELTDVLDELLDAITPDYVWEAGGEPLHLASTKANEILQKAIEYVHWQEEPEEEK